jgi:phosphatidylserine/phosphatidylglycerophosphate/cardiolipin synthase-like enzyme
MKLFAPALATLLISTATYASTFAPGTAYQLCFTPQANCTDLIDRALNTAKHTIYMQGYSFTSYPIGRALVRAKDRGVKVKVILDQSNFVKGWFSEGTYLMRHGIPIWNDNTLHIAHNKVLIIDQKIVETGSFNFTHAAQHHNAENVLIIYSPALAKQYFKNWEYRQKRSTKVN